MHYYINHDTNRVDFFLDNNKEPSYSIQLHFLPEYAMTQLNNLREIQVALQTTANIFKRMADQEESSDPKNFTYEVDYLRYKDTELRESSEELFRECLEYKEKYFPEPMKIDQLKKLYESNLLPQPPYRIMFTRSDGLIYDFTSLSKYSFEKIKSRE